MDIREVKKKRVSYAKEFKELEEKLALSLDNDVFLTLENKQNDLYKKILLCDLIIDSYNASDEDDFEELLKIFGQGSVL